MNFIPELWSKTAVNIFRRSVLESAILGSLWWTHVPDDEEDVMREMNNRQACLHD